MNTFRVRDHTAFRVTSKTFRLQIHSSNSNTLLSVSGPQEVTASTLLTPSSLPHCLPPLSRSAGDLTLVTARSPPTAPAPPPYGRGLRSWLRGFVRERVLTPPVAPAGGGRGNPAGSGIAGEGSESAHLQRLVQLQRMWEMHSVLCMVVLGRWHFERHGKVCVTCKERKRYTVTGGRGGRNCSR